VAARRDWRSVGACAANPQATLDLYSHQIGDQRKAAAVWCGHCRIRSACLAFALENNETVGVWGGLTEADRVRFRRVDRWVQRLQIPLARDVRLERPVTEHQIKVSDAR
jgi:WhiB family transcriptional regulator, redox-sensing transcriptional regulator